MHPLILPALLLTLSAPAATPATTPTPPPDWRPVSYAYTSYRSYRPYRRYRRYRPRHSYRYRSWKNNYLKKGGVTLSFRGGWQDLTHPGGPYQALQGRGSFGYTLGWNFNPFVHWGLSLDASFYGQKNGQLGHLKGIGMMNVTSDLTFRLYRPSDKRYVVPFLQLGLGVAILTGSKPKLETTEGCDGETETTPTYENHTLARGGIFQVGGGVEFFLTRWLSLSARALYRLHAMSGVTCAPGPNAICDDSDRKQYTLHGLVTDASLTIHWMSLFK